jgi:hypothetical protein
VFRVPEPCRAERVAVGLVAALLLGLYVWAAHYRTDPVDEGYFIYTSSRVLAGDLPYRDFSTPYTPGFFYLNAMLFRLFGMDLLTLHLSVVVARLALLGLVYLLARRIVPPAFAALPVVLLLAQDQAPAAWESHPAWWASVAMLLTVWCVCRHWETGRFGWWAAAGFAAGAAFAFKQNIGLFSLAALVALAVCEYQTPHDLPERSRLPGRLKPPRRPGSVVGPVCQLALSLIATRGMLPHLDPVVFVLFCLPFAALALERLASRRQDTYQAQTHIAWHNLKATTIRLMLLGLTFAVVTLPWLLALVSALGPGEAPLGAFVGAVDTAGYYLALEPPRPEALPVVVLVALGIFGAWTVCRPWPGPLKLGVGLATLALAGAFVGELFGTVAEVHPRVERAAILISVKATTNLLLYLPAIAFWSALGLLVAGQLPPDKRFYLRWYLVSASLLLLNQYPRMDEVHMLFSAPLAWIPGAYSLWRLYLWITLEGKAALAGRVTAYVAVLLVPLAAAWPLIEIRREELLVRQTVDSLWLAPPPHLPINLPGASIMEVDRSVWKFRSLAAYFQDHTRPEDRVFVYPAAPLLYYLIDRPNATRFNHILPGLLSPADEAEVIERLATVPAMHVIWDSFGAEFWTDPGDYQRLTDSIWENYIPVESIGGFEIMRRKTP